MPNRYVYSRGVAFPPQESLELYLPLWLPSLAGSTITSQDTNAISCTVVGAVYGSTGRTYAGGDDYIYALAATTTELDFTGAFTLCAWIYPTTITGDSRIVLERGEDAVNGWMLYVNGSGNIFIKTSQSATSQISYSDAAAVVINQWQFVCGTRSGTTGKVWKNLSDITTTSGSHSDPVTSASDLTIGIYYNKVSYPFIGIMGECFLYGRLLSITEMERIYTNTRWRYNV